MKPMGRIVLLLTFYASWALARGSELNCNSSTFEFKTDYSNMQTSYFSANCEGGYSVRMVGRSLGGHINYKSKITLRCLEDHPVGKYYGVKLNCSVGPGVCVGAFLSDTGMCGVYGVSAAGAGFSISGMTMTISHLNP